MNPCPHCGQPANPLRRSLYATTASYTCVACKKKSHFDRRVMAAFGSAGLFGAMSVRAMFHPAGLALAVTIVLGTAALMAGMFLSLRLRPVAE